MRALLRAPPATGSRALATRHRARPLAASRASPSDDPAVAAERRKALERVTAELNKKLGAGSIIRLGDKKVQEIERSPSGALTLDMALGGGWPRGKVIEIYGPESSGKTTLALHAVAEVQKAGGMAAFIDAEHAFDPSYAALLGVDVENLYFYQPAAGEEALDVADELMRSRGIDIVVLDSVSALVPRAELEGTMDQIQVGAQARMMSKGLKKLIQSASKSNCMMVFLNQLRNKVGVIYGSPEVTSGGNALKYYASVRCDVRQRGPLAEGAGNPIGLRVQAKIKKNKTAPPGREAGFDILFDSGIDTIGCVVDAAETLGVMTRRGAYYYYEDELVAQGRTRTIEALKGDAGRLEAIVGSVRDLMRGTVAGLGTKLGASAMDAAEDAATDAVAGDSSGEEDVELGEEEEEEEGEMMSG